MGGLLGNITDAFNAGADWVGDKYDEYFGNDVNESQPVDSINDVSIVSPAPISMSEEPDSLNVETEKNINEIFENNTQNGLLQTDNLIKQFTNATTAQDNVYVDTNLSDVELLNISNTAKELHQNALEEAQGIAKDQADIWDEVDADEEEADRLAREQDLKDTYGTTDLDKVKDWNQKSYEAGYDDVGSFVKDTKKRNRAKAFSALSEGLANTRVGKAYEYSL